MPIVFKENTIRLTQGKYPTLEVLHLSDFHLRGPNLSLERMIKDPVSKKRYDLVVLTGDLVEEKKGVDPFIKYISMLKKISRYGIFAVLGNHDHLRLGFLHNFIFNANSLAGISKNDFEEDLKLKMAKMGVKVLFDELEVVSIGGQKVYIIGIGDFAGIDRLQNWHSYQERIDKIRTRFKAIPPGSLTLVLSHVPDIVKMLEGQTIHVMFAGHTHGGQIRLPILGPLVAWSRFQRKYNRGLYNYNGTWLHVSSGLGTNRFTPIRFRCPSEISLIKIRGGA